MLFTKRTASEFERIADSILIGQANRDFGKTLAVTSCARREGKSTLIAALGEHLAGLGRKVLIVEDGAKRATARENTDEENGDFLSLIDQGPAGLAELSGPDPAEAGLSPVTWMRFGREDPAGRLLSLKMDALLQALESRYDHIFLDLPAYTETRLAALVVSRVKDTILVIRHRATSCLSIEQTRNQIERDGGRIIGAVMTQYKPCVPRFVQNFFYAVGATSKVQ